MLHAFNQRTTTQSKHIPPLIRTYDRPRFSAPV